MDLMDLTIVSSVGNRTSTCLIDGSSYDKYNNCFIELWF